MKKLFLTTIIGVLLTSSVFAFGSNTSPLFVKYATAIERVLEIFDTPEYKNGSLYNAYNRKVQFLKDKLLDDQDACGAYVDRQFDQNPRDPDVIMDECLTMAGWTNGNGYRGARPR